MILNSIRSSRAGSRIVIAALSVALWSGTRAAESGSYAVVLDEPVHGKLTLTPPLPPDGKYPAGTVVTVLARPDAGFALDAGYYSLPGRWGRTYHETMTPRVQGDH